MRANLPIIIPVKVNKKKRTVTTITKGFKI